MISNSERNEEHNILKLIIESGNYSDNTTLQRYYYNLLQYEQNPIELTDLLFRIILNSNNIEDNFRQLNEIEQKSYIIYFKNWLSKLQNLEDTSKITNMEGKIISLIKFFLFDSNNFLYSVNKNFFVEIFKILFSIMTKHSDINKMKTFYLSIKSEIKTCLMNLNQEVDFSRVKDYLIVIEAIASSEAQISKSTTELFDYFEILNFLLDFFSLRNLYTKTVNNSDKLIFLTSLITTFCKISSKFINDTFKKEEMLKHVYSSLNKNNFKENLDKKSEIDSINMASSYTENNETFFNTEIFSSIIKKILLINYDLYIELQSEDDINKFLIIIPTNDSIHNINTNISPSLVPSQIVELNLLKSHVVDLISSMTDFLNINNIFENFENFKNLSIILTEQIIKCLSSLNINIQERTENTKEETKMIKCIVVYLEFLINQVQTSNGADIFSANKLEIFRYIILPNLKTSELEHELFLIEPEEFMNTLYDMSSKQQSRSPKVKSLKLIDIMCEYIDSFLKFVTEYYTDIIKYLIVKNKSNKNEDYTSSSSMFSIISDSKIQSIFLDYISSLTDEELLEQSLQVLASISYLIFERPNIRTFFEDKIDSINYNLIDLKDEFIKAKLCNFYAFTLDDMFHDNIKVFSKSFYDSMNFLIQCVIDENKNISLNFIALDSINSIIFDEAMKGIVSEFVQLNMRAILNLINLPYFNELTSNALYYKTVKNLIAVYFNVIEKEIFYIFQFFWFGIQKQLEEIIIKDKKSNLTPMIKFTNSEESVLKEKNFKLFEKMQSLISLLKTSISRCSIVENKSLIFNEILKLLQYIDSFINYEYEEEILEMIQIVLNDLKLVPNVYIECIAPLIEKLSSEINGNKYKFEEYHINFIFTFLKNLREENFLSYKEMIFNLISKRLSLAPVKQYEICKNEKENLTIINLLIVYIIFFWDFITFNDIYNENSNDDCNKIINLLKFLLTKRSIVNEDLITRILFTFYLVTIKIDSVHAKITNFKNFEIFLLKSISFSGRGGSVEENSISSIFASKMILNLVTSNQSIITEFNDVYKDNTIINYIKHLINFNIDNLLFLKKEAMNMSKSKEKDMLNESNSINLDNINIYNNELNTDEGNNFAIGLDYKNKLKKDNMKVLMRGNNSNKRTKIENFYVNSQSHLKNKKKNINKKFKEFEYDLDEISQDDSEECEDDDSSQSNFGDDEDFVEEIINEGESDDEFVNENDDRDEEFVKVKKNDIHKLIENFSSLNFKSYMFTKNEFKLLDSVLSYIQQYHQKFYEHILANFSKTKLKVLESIRHFQKISDVKGITKFRKILRIKRK